MRVRSIVWLFAASLIPLCAQTAVMLTPSPTAVTFTYTIGSALPAAQAVSVRASAGTPAYTVTVTGTNTQWLTVAPDSGLMPANLSVRVNPTSLAIGTYQATINFAATGVANPLKIGVTLTVSSALPTLSVSAASLTFASPPAQPVVQTVKLTTTGGPIPFTAAAGSAWLSVSPATGVVLPGSPVTLSVLVDSTTLAPSATPYAGKITIAASGVPAANKTQIVNVAFTVNSLLPVITSIWPTGVLVNTPTATVTIRGTGFYAASVVKIGTQSLPTTVVGSTAVLATIPPVLLSSPGTLNFIVSNPAPGGDSASTAFIVTATPTIQITSNAASGVAGSVSPGEVVTMYGQGIGPLSPSSMQDADNNGFVDTTVGGYTVLIDSVAAPILYLSEDQVTVQVPYEVTQGANKPVQISNGTTTALGSVTIAPAAPGIFTLNGTGQGQAAALNYVASTQSYSLNGATTPAKVGDTVILYLTGEGDYASTLSLRTGLLISPALSNIPQMNPLPTVTIGAQAATVTYAGPVLGSLLGILQLSVTVPAGTPTGAAVPVSIQIGSVAAQTGVTLVIK